MEYKPIIVLILVIVAGIVQLLKNVLAKRAAQHSQKPSAKRDRAYEVEEELRRFLESVSGEEITHQPPSVAPPKLPPPLPRPVAPMRPPLSAQPVALPPVITQFPAPRSAPMRSTVQVPVLATARFQTVPAAAKPAPSLIQVPQLAQAATAVPPSGATRLQSVLTHRSLLQQGILFSEILGPPRALRDS